MERIFNNREGINPVDQFAYHDNTSPIDSWGILQRILEGSSEDHTYPREKPTPDQQTPAESQAKEQEEKLEV